jgi:hypothetical protein
VAAEVVVSGIGGFPCLRLRLGLGLCGRLFRLIHHDVTRPHLDAIRLCPIDCLRSGLRRYLVVFMTIAQVVVRGAIGDDVKVEVEVEVDAMEEAVVLRVRCSGRHGSSVTSASGACGSYPRYDNHSCRLHVWKGTV